MNSLSVKKAYKCSVEGCQRISSEAGIIFHRLPVVQHIREQWIEKCNLTKVRKNTFICSTHFTKEDYLPTRNYERRRLKKIAVPSLLMMKKKSRFIPNVLKKGGDKIFTKSVEKTAQAEQKKEVNAELKTISNNVQIIEEIVFIDYNETKNSVNNNLT